MNFTIIGRNVCHNFCYSHWTGDGCRGEIIQLHTQCVQWFPVGMNCLISSSCQIKAKLVTYTRDVVFLQCLSSTMTINSESVRLIPKDLLEHITCKTTLISEHLYARCHDINSEDLVVFVRFKAMQRPLELQVLKISTYNMWGIFVRTT